MSNVYFGTTTVQADGNWNNVANWYTSSTGGALGRLPNPSTDSVQICNGPVTTGPTGGYSGSVTVGNLLYPRPSIAAGNYSGPIAVNYPADITGGTYSGTVTVTGAGVLSAGTFNGTVTGTSLPGGLTISGGTFNGSLAPNASSFTVSGGTFHGSIAPVNGGDVAVTGGTFTGTFVDGDGTASFPITGGTFAPAVTINVTNPSSTSWPFNPGFGDPYYGSVFAPVLTFTNLPAGGPVITNALVAVGTQGKAFTYQVTASGSPTSYGATGLPAGLSINTTTGLISGTPTGTGVSIITLSVTNASGTNSQNLVLQVLPQFSPNMTPSQLELDQRDIYARLQNDVDFSAGIPVLLELKGITERDVAMAISTSNAQAGLVGSVAIVLMPTLLPDSPNAPGPRFDAVYKVQVIDWPMMRRQPTTGTQQSADEIADRVREILHRFTMGRGQTIYFAGQEPVAVPDGKVSYILKFKRTAADQPPVAVATVGISATAQSGPATVTLSCQTSGAAIYFTTDGSYPGSNSAACPTAQLYTAPFAVTAGQLVRAAAELAGYQQSQVIAQYQF